MSGNPYVFFLGSQEETTRSIILDSFLVVQLNAVVSPLSRFSWCRIFVEKLAHLNGSRPDPLERVGKLGEADALDMEAYVNPETGEIGGQKGPEPTRYGDWESKGRCTDF